MTQSITASVLVPVANEADARATAAAMEPFDVGDVTVLHVVEKGDGVPDKTPVEQSEQVAEAAFAAVRETYPDADTTVAYDRNVVDAIIETAADLDASAVVFRPHQSGRLTRFLSGDRSLRLVTAADRPVVALPDPDTIDDADE